MVISLRLPEQRELSQQAAENPPLVYIVVLNYCSSDDTLACVDALRRVDYQNLRLLVIDNASPDDSGQMLKVRIPTNEYLQLPKNLGYAGGNNEGMRIAMANGASYILIVNPDVRLSPDSVKSYVEVLERDETVAALNPIQLSGDGQSIDATFLRGVLQRAGLQPTDLDGTLFKEVDTLYGAALMLRVTSIEKVGGFDPLYFAYHEERDFCRRLKHHGLRLVVTGKAPVTHLRTKTRDRLDERRLFLHVKGFYLYSLKNPQKSFTHAAQDTIRLLFLDTIRKPKGKYPLSLPGAGRRHLIMTVLWILWHLGTIRVHRQIDSAGRAYV
jgi:GT2 family glycosyltransferase